MRLRTVGLIAAVALSTTLAPLVAAAQPTGKLPRVGVLSPFDDNSFVDAFRHELRELGYVEGRSVVLEHRSAEGRADRLPDLAAELVRLRVDVIVTMTPPGARATKQATTTIPIVIGEVDDAVEQGFVTSLARPGGNITGTSWLNTELSAKRLELLKEALPRVSRVAILREAVGGASALRATVAAGRTLGLQLQVLELRDPDELPSAFATMARERAGALDVLPGLMITSHMRSIVELAGKGRLPAIFPDGRFVAAGGLMSYGPSLLDMYRRAAVFVDKILKGTKPAALPVEQPTRLELAVNLKTAKALGLILPQSVLVRADYVITQ